MKYGWYNNDFTVLITNTLQTGYQVSWAENHDSSGLYNYRSAKHGVYWHFTKSEDAVIFALKFK